MKEDIAQAFMFVLYLHNFPFRTPLMLAVENGHVDTVLYLIANSATVNARDIHGRTALHRGVCVRSK